jgi:glutaredoxin
VKYEVLELDHAENGEDVQKYLIEKTGQKTVPMTFIKGEGSRGLMVFAFSE